MTRVLAVLVLLVASLATVARATEPDSPRDAVVLLHGLARSDRSMRPLEDRLTMAGFDVHNFAYASTEQPPEALVEQLSRRVAACCGDAPRVHFVGHSLGGILIRAYLAETHSPNVGRVVMLAPPNRGSEVVDTLRDYAAFRWAFGPAAQQLGTNPDSLPNRLPAPTVEVGVIAATGTVNPVGSMIIPDEDDGVVSLDSTKLDGMTDFVEVASSHAFIMKSDEAGTQVIHFLRSGHFQHELPE